MAETIRKISLGVIYLGVVVILFSPLLVDNRFFFPFISTKVFLFRLVVEVMLLSYLALNVVSQEYRPRLNWLTAALAVFILIATVSSLVGENFYLSFWGDIERGEGLLLWLHLLAFFLILVGTIRESRAWAALLDISVGVGVLMALFGLGQVLKVSSLLATSGTRVDAALGNPAFFAAYLLFHLAFASYLFTIRKSWFLKGYYLLAALFFAGLIPATQTRGAVLGLVAGVMVAALLLAWTNRENVQIRRLSLGVVILLVLGAGILYAARRQPWVKNSPVLGRLVTISLRERTAETRLATWAAAWGGWREKFFLGYGLENFDTVFNKRFPPIIYEDEGSQVWFDRAHNLIFDRGVTTGIFGLLAFLGFLLYPLYYFLRRGLADPGRRKFAVMMSGLVVAYLIQDLFIFESIVIYLILFFTWAWFAATVLPHWERPRLSFGRGLAVGLLVVYAAALGPLLWKVNLYPAKVNSAAAEALRSNPRDEDFFLIIERFKKAIEPPTYGRQEYRLQFIEFVDQQLQGVGEVVPEVRPVVAYTDQEASKQIAEAPKNAKNLLLVMRHYNYTRDVEPMTRQARLEKALSFYPQLQELTPTRPQIHQEAGYSNLYLYRLMREEGDAASAERYLAAAELNFQKTIELNPKVVESYINLAMLYLNTGENQKLSSLLLEMDRRRVSFRSPNHLRRLLQLSKANNNFSATVIFSRELTVLEPENAAAWIDLALSYAYLGDRQQALLTAERIKAFGDPYIAEAEQFIQNVNRGFYEKR